jgi:rhodanese-related sulfurtransferase
MRTTTRRRTIDHLLADARESIERLTPRAAFDAAGHGAALVDVRSADEQRRQGVLIPGAVHHPLSVVAWRLDPACPTSNAKIPLETPVILLCREGYSSSLAAPWLRAIGFERVGDVVGGVDAWRASGLPTTPAA